GGRGRRGGGGVGGAAGGGAARAVPAGAGAARRRGARRARAATTGGAAVDFALTPGQRELRARGAGFVGEVLIRLELTAELAGGRLPEADRRHVRDQARERGLDSR